MIHSNELVHWVSEKVDLQPSYCEWEDRNLKLEAIQRHLDNLMTEIEDKKADLESFLVISNEMT